MAKKKTLVRKETARGDFVDFETSLMEATQTVEQELAVEDAGWILLGSATGDIVTADQRKTYRNNSRIYYTKDPLGRQAIRLWTDYTFGSGMTWSAPEKATQKALDEFWGSIDNEAVLSPRGQRRSSDKLLVDGEVFFAVFLGPTSTIRLIDPAEITEIISDPDDVEKVMYYKRDWADSQGKSHTAYYRSFRNIKGAGCKDSGGVVITQTDKATPLVYHLPYNTTGQRGNPLLLPALDWLKQYRRFLASRVAYMLALAKFVGKNKTSGGAAAVAAIQAKLQDASIPAGSVMVENMGSDFQWLPSNSGAGNAYQDARMLKLQVCAAVGIPEQYFGAIDCGNLATAKTVELPMLKMFQSYQQVWQGAYKAIDELVLANAKVPPDKWYVDRDFPAIAPEDAVAIAQSILTITQAMPDLAGTEEVRSLALTSLGINDPTEVLDVLKVEPKKSSRPLVAEPGAPVVTSGEDTAENIAAGAKLNGIQIQAAVAVLKDLINGYLPEAVGLELLVAVGIDRDRAEAMVKACNKFTPALDPTLPITPKEASTANLIKALREYKLSIQEAKNE